MIIYPNSVSVAKWTQGPVTLAVDQEMRRNSLGNVAGCGGGGGDGIPYPIKIAITTNLISVQIATHIERSITALNYS